MELSDGEIITSIKSGDSHRFSLLVDRYKDKAMTLAVRMVKNREDAEEIVQDAFIRAYRGLDKFEGKARFGTWLYRIVYNLCLTKIGRLKTPSHVEKVERSEDFQIPDEQAVDPYEVLEEKEAIAVVKSIIDELPDRYSTVLSLFYFQELSYNEICEVTGLPLGTIKAHLFRARNLLHKRLAEKQCT